VIDGWQIKVRASELGSQVPCEGVIQGAGTIEEALLQPVISPHTERQVVTQVLRGCTWGQAYIRFVF